MDITLGIILAYLLVAVCIAWAFSGGGIAKTVKLMGLSVFWLPLLLWFIWPKKGFVGRAVKRIFRSDI